MSIKILYISISNYILSLLVIFTVILFKHLKPIKLWYSPNVYFAVKRNLHITLIIPFSHRMPPSVSSAPISAMRVFMFSLGFLECCLFGATINGWPALVLSLKQEKIYEHLCNRSSTESNQASGHLFTIYSLVIHRRCYFKLFRKAD